MSRYFLVAKFACALCGRGLEIKDHNTKNGIPYAEGEPTGADMAQTVIDIVPCQCVTSKLQKIQDAVKMLNSA